MNSPHSVKSATAAAADWLSGQDCAPTSHKTRFCIVVDPSPETRGALSAELHQLGVETTALRAGTELADALADRTPDLVFLDVSGTAADALGAMLALKQVSYSGLVQLMGHGEKGILPYFKELGGQFGLSMLANLSKPVQMAAVRGTVRDHKLGGPAIIPLQVSLKQAIERKWVEFWYQPKIDFTTRRAVGAESFARIHHPRKGVLGPAAFMPDADDDALTELAQMAIIGALQLGSRFDQLGLTVKIAANISVDSLAKIPVHQIVGKYRPSSSRWTGLILDVTEQQLYRNAAFLQSIAPSLQEVGVRFALDDFGRGNCSLGDLKSLSFAEIKIDRHFARNCGTETGNGNICKTIVNMARNFGSDSVAIGVETASEAQALKAMGCTLGQGFFFSAPLPEDQFFKLLCARTESCGPAAGVVKAM